MPADMHLPPPNPYIATDFTIKSLPQGAPQEQAMAGVVAAAQEETRQLAEQMKLPVVLAAPPDMVHDKPGGAHTET